MITMIIATSFMGTVLAIVLPALVMVVRLHKRIDLVQDEINALTEVISQLLKEGMHHE